MKRRHFLTLTMGMSLAGGVTGTGIVAGRIGQLHWRDRSLLGFGTVLSLRAAHSSAVQAERALDAAVVTIRHIEDQMSLFDPDSAISRLNRDGVLHRPHPDLVKVLNIAQAVSAQSGGSFDVTVQPLWKVFDEAARRQDIPSPAELGRARAAVGWKDLVVSGDVIRLRRPQMGVTLNGIAQGFAADLVRQTLRAHGVEHALINTGEWASLGRPEHARSWLLGVADPRHQQAIIARLALDNRCIAVSADNECGFTPDRRHHHIFDPSTGYSPPELSSVTVVARSCAIADALTKVMFVAGRKDAIDLARQWQVDVLVVQKNGDWEASPGLNLRSA
jgi:FAD:protein FMN transferase